MISKAFLFPVRQGRNTDQKLSPTAEKRHRDRERRGRIPVHCIRFTPHLMVRIGNRAINALIDTGSEISLINQITAQTIWREKVQRNNEVGQVQLADGLHGTTTDSLYLCIHIGGRTMRHRFHIMPKLESEFLLGINLLMSTGISLHPPRSLTRIVYQQSLLY